MAKIAIVGSRKWSGKTPLARVGDLIWRLPLETVIVSGGASGVDTEAEMAARARGMNVEIYRPNYKIENPRRAPLLRNTRIAMACDGLIAFWDGESRGTRDVIEKARFLKKPVWIYFS